MTAQITELTLERMLVYAHFHHTDMAQYELAEALLTEVARLRILLEKIRKDLATNAPPLDDGDLATNAPPLDTCVMGSDGGHTGVEAMVIEGLKFP